MLLRDTCYSQGKVGGKRAYVTSTSDVSLMTFLIQFKLRTLSVQLRINEVLIRSYSSYET